MNLNVLQTVASLKKISGGPARSVTGLCDSLGELGCSIGLLSMDSNEDLDECIQHKSKNVKFVSGYGINVPFFKNSLPVNHSRIIFDLNQRSQLHLIHDHGLWLPCNHVVSKVARKLGVVHVVSPRGMLEPWALNYKSWKKKIVWNLWASRDLHQITAFCATSEKEAENIRKLGFTQPIANIPNSVSAPSLMSGNFSRSNGRQVLFLSRIHPKKGVCELVEAWSKIRPFGWELIIAGPDENDHAKKVRNLIVYHGLESVVHLVGSIEGEEKWKLFERSDLFILPTYSENFGIVVAESLAMGTPVITTKGAPWESLIGKNCGWWIDISIDAIVEALNKAVNLTDDERFRMGENGRNYVNDCFGSDSIGRKMKYFYLWLLGEEGKPDWVYDD
jgi:glycosyltransferase involved in cell wall biosynthesis